jgi:hypothetical protein
MFAFTDEERAQLSEFRAITTDEQGREVLVGLTLEETAFYMAHVKRRPIIPDREGRKRYIELDKKHELARLAVLGAEVQRRNENPPLH